MVQAPLKRSPKHKTRIEAAGSSLTRLFFFASCQPNRRNALYNSTKVLSRIT